MGLPPSDDGGSQLSFIEVVVMLEMEGERGIEGAVVIVSGTKSGYVSSWADHMVEKSHWLRGGLVVLFLK